MFEPQSTENGGDGLPTDPWTRENISASLDCTRKDRSPQSSPRYTQHTVASSTEHKSLKRQLEEDEMSEDAIGREELSSFDVASQPNEAISVLELTDDSAMVHGTMAMSQFTKKMNLRNTDNSENVESDARAAGEQIKESGWTVNTGGSWGNGRSPFLARGNSPRTLWGSEGHMRTENEKEPSFNNKEGEIERAKQGAGIEGMSWTGPETGLEHYASATLEKQLPQSFDEEDTESRPNAANGPLVGEKEVASCESELSSCPVDPGLSSTGCVSSFGHEEKKPFRFARFFCCLAGSAID